MGNYHQKKGKGKLPLFNGNEERVITIHCNDIKVKVMHIIWMHQERIIGVRWQAMHPSHIQYQE